MEDLLSTEELIDQLTSEAMAGRMVLLTGSDPEAVSERLGLAVERLIDFGVELMRFDALQFHSASSLMAELADVLGIDTEHVMVGLKIRGQTGNPMLMVVDNAECLAADARASLRLLAKDTEGGLGVIYGGEPDAETALLDAGIPLSLVLESAEIAEQAPQHIGVSEDRPARPPRSSALAGVTIPWRHLAAVLGLLLLIWLFWPGEEPGPDVRELSMPASPGQVVTIGDEPIAVVPEVQESVALELDPPPRPAAEPEATADVAPAPAPTPAPAPAPAPKPAPRSTPAPAPAPQSTTPALTGMAAELGYRNEDWLLAQSASSWVLQIAVATSEDAARAMLDRLGRERSAYYRARRDGRVVFVVLAGTWATREQALAGRDRLVDEFRQRGPFPRELRAVHSEIIAVR